MDINLKDLSSGLETSNNNTNRNLNANKIKILENKISIYQKENQALKNKVRILQDSNDEKNTKIQEQLNHLSNLENDNNSLKKLYEKSKTKFNDETSNFYTNKREHEKEITNMKYMIEELKSENEKLLKSISIQNKENKNLQQNLLKTANENKLYSQDNTILLSKVKEYEDNLFMLNNNKINSNNNNFLQTSNNLYDNKLSLYSTIINDEINIIAKYIDTYLNLNYIENMNLNIPQLQKITSFPDGGKFAGFSNIVNSVENAMKRIMTQNKIIKNNELMLKQEINKLNNLLEKKNNENIELKREMSELKRKFFYLKNDFDKINNDLTSQKGFNKKIQNTMNDINNGNDDYIKGLYQTIKSELDKILNEPLLHSYLSIILEQRNKYNNNFANNGMKYIFEEILDKYILINNCIVEDFKKIKSENNYGIGIDGNLDMRGNMRELEIANDELKSKLIQKDKIISSNKDEKKLLINQINILQRDILNLRNRNINIEKNNENKPLNFDYSDNIKNNNYLSMPLFPHKELMSNDNNEIIERYKPTNIEEQNKFKNNNNIENYGGTMGQQYINIDKINLNNDNINNEEMKDNQNDEEEEENEIYYEGQQFPNQEPSSDLYNNNNFENMNNYNNNNFGNNDFQQQYMNNEQDDNENEIENEENNEFNNNQFQEIIEEEENENNTMEGESNKNKSIKNSKINNNINMNYNYNNPGVDINNLNNYANNNNNSEEEYINENQINEQFINKNKSQGDSKSNEIIGNENENNPKANEQNNNYLDAQMYNMNNMIGKNMENKGMKDFSGNIESKEKNNIENKNK